MKGGFRGGGLDFAPLPTPHKRFGEGVAGFDLSQKGRPGDAIIMRWTMTTTMMARGGSKGKSINDSISEHKCIVTRNIIYSITVLMPINNNCMVALFL
jgi:hypothetical protein